MKKALLYSFLLTFGAIHLTSCASWSSDKKAYCRSLRSKIVFNGATLNTRQQEIDRAEKPLQQSSYNNECDNT